MKNLKWLLLSLTFLFVAPSAFAYVATTTATPTIVVPTTNKISFKQKIKLFKDFLLKKSEDAPMPKSTGWFWGGVVSIVAAAFLLKRSDDLAKAAAAKSQGSIVGDVSLAGVGELLLGLVLASLGIVLFIIFLAKLKKEKAKKQNTEGSPKTQQ